MSKEIKKFAEIAYGGERHINSNQSAKHLALFDASIEILQDRITACEIVNKVIGGYLLESGTLPSLQNVLRTAAENIRENADSEDAQNNARSWIVAHYVEQALNRYDQENGTPKFEVIEGGLEDH